MVSPNQLTVLRMAFVPVLIILISYHRFGWALALFFLAGLTDGLDGLIARKMGKKTPLGAYLDPIADKLLLVSSFLVLSVESVGLDFQIPLWLTITVISRDLLLVVSALTFTLVIGRRSFPPSILGKYTTAFQLLLVMVVLVSNFLGYSVPGLQVVVWITLFLTVSSGLHYMLRGMKLVASESES